MESSPPAPGGPGRSHFSARTAAFLVVSSTVGGGVFGTAGYVVLDAGGHGGAMVIWLIGGLIAACGAFSLAEVSASLPRSGGEFVILSEAYGPLVGFLGGWVSLLFGFVAPIAATGYVAAEYLMAPVGWTSPAAARLAATVAIVALAVAHSLGRAGTERVQGLATTATLVVLATFILAGLWVGWTPAPHFDGPRRSGGLGLFALFVGIIRVSYAYTGWNGASYVAGEIADVQRSLPRAVIAGTAVVIALYLGLAGVFALAVPADEIRAMAALDRSSAERLGELAARRLFGPRGASAISWSIGVALLASLSAMVLTGPRVARAMALEGRLPIAVGRSVGRGDAPIVATALVSFAAIALLWAGGFEAITFAAGVGLALNSLLTVAAVYVLRKKRPDLDRPFRVPGYPFVPAVYLALTAAALGFAAFDPDQRASTMAGIGGVVAGVPLYYLSVAARRKPRRIA